MTPLQFRFDTGAATHEGCVRSLNEDRFLAAPDSGLWLVADGMGGHWGGDYAAACIVEHAGAVGRAASAAAQEAQVADSLARANAAIRARSACNDGVTIGATVAALVVHGAQFVCLWAGDSRVYLLRGGRLLQLTRDHSEVQDLLDRGAITPAQARAWPRRNVITRAVGTQPALRLDRAAGPVQAGDLFLLCSDGLTAHLADAEIRDRLAGRAAQPACDGLLRQTLDRGATDNVTVVAVRCAVAAPGPALGPAPGAGG